MTAAPRAIPVEPADLRNPPELDTATLDDAALVAVEGVAGYREWLVPEAHAALEARALIVYAEAPPGLPTHLGERHGGRLRIRLYRYSGSAWYGGKWCGRGEWYATAYVGATRTRRGSVNVYLGKWRAPGVRVKSANGKPTPAPLSPEGIRRAVTLVSQRLPSATS